MASTVRYGLLVLLCFFLAGEVWSQDTVRSEEMQPPVVVESDTFFVEPNKTTSASAIYFDSISEKQIVFERKLPDSVVKAVKNDEAYWYANLAPEKKEIKPRRSFTDMSWFRTLFWILITGAFVALLAWFLATGNIFLFRKKSKPIKEEEETGDTENIHELDFDKEIRQAIDAKNFRLAIRMLYLQTLRRLSDKELINYTHERTNSDYLRQLSGTRFYKEFFRLTRNFEYTWYGEFPVNEETFSLIQKDFSDFNQSLP